MLKPFVVVFCVAKAHSSDDVSTPDCASTENDVLMIS